MIQRIEYSNVKDRTGGHDLGPITAIVGPNFSGKTAIADAIRIGLLGHHPELGNNAPATMQLTSRDSMTVTLKHEHGRTDRAWVRKGKTVKKTEAGVQDFEPSWLDAKGFIGASPKERIRLVVGGKAGGAEKAIERLGFSPSLVKTFDDLEGLAVVEDEKAKELRLEIKRWEGLLQGSAEIEAEAAALPPAPDMDALRRATIEAQEVRAAMTSKTDALQRAVEAADRHDAQGSAHVKILATADARMKEIAAEKAEAEASEKERAAREQHLRIQISTINGFLQATKDLAPDQLEAFKVEVEEAITLLPEDAKTLHTAWQQAQQADSRAAAAHTAATAAVEQKNKAKEAFDGLECCPTCRATAPGWKAAVLETLSHQLLDAIEAEREAATAHQKAHDAHREAKEAYDTAAAINRRIENLPSLQDALANHQKRAEQRAALGPIDDALQQLCTSHFEDRIAQLKEEQGDIQAAISWLERKPVRPTPEQILAETDFRDRAIEAYDAALQAQLAGGKIEDQRREFEARASTAREARKRLDEAATKLETAVAKAKEIRRVVKEESDALWGKISDVAQEFSVDLLRHPLAMNPTGEIGYWNGPSWVPFEAMSGSEQLVASAAIQIGLQEPGHRIVMLDELSRMTQETKVAFVDKLEDAIKAGKLDQAILIDHDDYFWEETGDSITKIHTTK